MAVDVACEMKKVAGTKPVTVEDVLSGSAGTYGIMGLVERADPAYRELTTVQKERLAQDIASFLDELADQSIIECSAGLENADRNGDDDILF